eukprot:CAMPEP_0181227376 /NCGR_PEP_ID=MMETSP1096-20121128/32755_1 /TAXON_ID=156174 ORGANISM="Chrysochromulina ericina, Strain CCMP281" /NCGR_SAMPLE_ID=MMETSP1096 /ASSEMBLY_ACC=CAM_ASM_000453 /LENGTH=38 /DNA_ID= /DNA_START= /DNA_END= /DNA_ORIENTATION=
MAVVDCAGLPLCELELEDAAVGRDSEGARARGVKHEQP